MVGVSAVVYVFMVRKLKIDPDRLANLSLHTG